MLLYQLLLKFCVLTFVKYYTNIHTRYKFYEDQLLIEATFIIKKFNFCLLKTFIFLLKLSARIFIIDLYYLFSHIVYLFDQECFNNIVNLIYNIYILTKLLTCLTNILSYQSFHHTSSFNRL